MADAGTADAAGFASDPPSEYNPFDREDERRPDQRYWCDRGLWSAYQASILLITLAERNRCRKIIQTYAEKVPIELRATLFELAQEI
jgi:hypothetical protein